MALAGRLKQATAVTLKVGPFVDASDGVTPLTGLTIQKADVRLSKNGGNFAAANADQGTSDAGAAHDELGVYDISLNTTDTGTAGILTLIIAPAGALPILKEYEIVSASEYSLVVRRNTAQAGDATTITLDSGASATDASYNGMVVAIVAGTGAGQFRTITGYVGSTKVATVEPAWATNPSSDSVFELLGTPPGAGVESAVGSALGNYGAATNADIVAVPGAVWDEVPTEPTAAPTWGVSAFRDWLAYQLARLRNKSTFNSSTGAWALRNDDDDADIATRTDTSVGSVYTKGEES